MNKWAIIMRGVPGSNKRLFIGEMLNGSAVVHSLEDYLLPEDNRRIDETNRVRLNSACFKAFSESIVQGERCVVFCHTNIIPFRFSKYQEFAERYGYSVAVITMAHPDSEVAAQRTTRNISASEIWNMINLFRQ